MSSAAVSSSSDMRNSIAIAGMGNKKMSDLDNDDKIGSQKNNVITPQMVKSKKSKKQRAKIVATMKTSLDLRMSVEKNIVDELLLVCGVIGTTTNSGNGSELVPVTDCLNWLQDLQRALRRDEDLYRPICLLLGKWKIVEHKLLPLVVSCRYDTPIVLTVLKILVILTKPLSENSQRAGQMIIDTTSAKSDPAVVAQQIKLRQNALSQAEQLMVYKRLITFHPSNYEKDKSEGAKGTGILSVFVSLLAEPLSKSGASRTDADHLTIELVLHLIRNLLSAHPLLNTSSETSRQAAQLHQDMISLFERELVLEILLVVGQEMELRENAQYNLLMMEILHHIVKTQDPTIIARHSHSKAAKDDTKSSTLDPEKKSLRQMSDSAGGRSSRPLSFSSSSALASKLKEERSQLNNMKAIRHGNFSGTWMRRQSDGRRQFVGASSIVQGSSRGAGTRGLVQARRKNRLAEPFIGSGKSLLAHTRSQYQMTGSNSGPSAKRCNRTLDEFCRRFLADCYGPFMKSIKNEFRRDSQRLEEKDKIVFFKLVWFFAQWSRNSQTSSRRSGKDDTKETVGRLIITMDVFTFNLVLNATETFYQQKKFTRLAQAVALYAEMIHLLHRMFISNDKTEHEMAMGLIDRLFYHGQDALDQLPKLLSRWTPGTYTREYLCDLIEVAHVSLKVLEANTRKGTEFFMNKNGAHNDVDGKKLSKKIVKMRKDAAEFDVKSYFVRKIISNQLVSMYTYLLEQYKVNAAVVNHRIISMFLRVMRLEIASPDTADERECINPLETRRVTLEPMLYSLQLLLVLERILNDDTIQRDSSYESLIMFSTSFMYKFWSAASSNPMLYVECLFQHAAPHRFCESFTNMYVNDELRLLAKREILEEEFGVDDNKITSNVDDDDDDEAELEFTGDTLRESSLENTNTNGSEDVGNKNKISELSDDEDGQEGEKRSSIFRKRLHDDENDEAGLEYAGDSSRESSSNEITTNEQKNSVEKTVNTDMGISESSDDDAHPETEKRSPISTKRSRESGDEDSDGDLALLASEMNSKSPAKKRNIEIGTSDDDDSIN